jgi:hypothetical protein
MEISVFVPTYPVMVIAPLLVVKMNWACATGGSNIPNAKKRVLITRQVFMFWQMVTQFHNRARGLPSK